MISILDNLLYNSKWKFKEKNNGRQKESTRTSYFAN